MCWRRVPAPRSASIVDVDRSPFQLRADGRRLSAVRSETLNEAD